MVLSRDMERMLERQGLKCSKAPKIADLQAHNETDCGTTDYTGADLLLTKQTMIQTDSGSIQHYY